MKNLYILKYNNYYNRIIKKHSRWADYNSDPECTIVFTQYNANFNPNDGVETKHIIGTTDYNGIGDYMLVCNVTDGTIFQRWFILEHKRTKGGQYELTLRRDIISDYQESVISAPMIINRAMITDTNSPLLFNKEGGSYNQIKTNEILLKDGTKMPWYIIYFPLNVVYPSGQSDFAGSFSLDDISVDEYSGYDITSSNSPWKAGSSYSYVDDYQFYINYNPEFAGGGVIPMYRVNKLQVPNNILSHFTTINPDEDYIWFTEDVYTVTPKLVNAFNSYVVNNTLIPGANAQYLSGRTLKDQSWFETIKKWNGKTFLLKTDVNGVVKYYNVTVNYTKYSRSGNITDGSTLFNTMKGIINDAGIPYRGNIDDLSFDYSYNEYQVNIAVSEYQTQNTINWHLGLDSHAKCSDAPYQIIAIPAGELNVQMANSGNSWSTPQISEMLVNAIIQTCTSTNILDVQLLPYFPYISEFPPEKLIDFGDGRIEMEIFNQYVGEDPEFVDFITERQYQPGSTRYDGVPSGYGYNIFYIDSANFTFDINQSIAIPNRTNSAVMNKKLSSELDLVRLVSPNYNGQFEFSLAKNNGVDYFNVDVTLKPYNPYIHVNPNFKSLYGLDYNDARGLICNGDFSLPIVNDPWKQYELQNKNYQQIFNRQIEHMEFQQGQERTLAGINLFTGTMQGAVAGATAGGMIGHGIGAGIGAGVGAITSLIGGIADYSMMGARHQEDKDFAIDNWNYQLGNIKALPYSITKVTPLTYNNKLFPFVEFYSATDEEVNILRNKILYNSMKVEKIGTVSEYMQETRTFIQGTLIRLEGTDLGEHEVYEIHDELKKGVYI